MNKKYRKMLSNIAAFTAKVTKMNAALPIAAKAVTSSVFSKTFVAPNLLKSTSFVAAKSAGFSIMWPVALLAVGGYTALYYLTKNFDLLKESDKYA